MEFILQFLLITSGGSLYMVLCVCLFICMCVYRIEDDIRALPPDQIRAFLVGDPTPVLTLSVCLFYKIFGHGLGSKL